MDLNLIRAVVTVLSFVCFVGIWIWAWNGRNRERFEHLARQCIDLPDAIESNRDNRGQA